MDKELILEKGNRISLRFITKDDTDLVVKWRNNERVRNNFRYREHFTREIHEKWLDTKVATGEVVQMIICENDQDYRPVGSVYFRDIDPATSSAEYGIFIGEEDAIGKGYGNETVVLALKYGKEVLKLKHVILRVFADNEAATRSYLHAGFVKTKDLPMEECSDGQKSDMILMEKDLT